MADEVRTEVHDRTLVVTIDRPAARNAIDGPTAAALFDVFTAFDADDAYDVAVLTGADGAFCSGADLKAIGSGNGNRIEEDMTKPGPLGCTRLLLTKPVIAAVEGPAVAGGLELALWCDLRIASEGSRLGFAERRWGVPLIDGGTQRLPRIVGLGRALDLILTGRTVEAAEALAMGLVNEIAENPLERALELAEALAAHPQQTMLGDRRAAIDGSALPLPEGLAIEAAIGRANLADAMRGAARFAAGEGRGGAAPGRDR